MRWLHRCGALIAVAMLLGPVQAQTQAQTQAQAQAQPQPPSSPPAEPAQPTTQERPAPTWLPRGAAELQALDKVNARHAVLNVKVGGQGQYGSLRIEVQACVVRPPTEPQDAAAFLSITDASGEGVPFRGWMFANEPALSMLQHPMFDIRVIGCKP